ncbi:hypothetical protein [Streptomyces jumonjinensis]|uniref:hypothetical protein n=1 Tax=Streptomyces jumonjinensis TaxID=1945 RepID=UPI0037A894D1
MLDAEGGGVGGSGGASDLERGVGALKKFHQQVVALLAEFEGGEGGTAKIAEQRVSRGSFSGSNLPFAEADGFFSQYNRVHASLVSLTKSLGDQIEALTIGVHAADVGFDNVEEEMRQRFHAIQGQLERQRVAAEKQDRVREQKRSEQAAEDSGHAVPTDLG